MNQQEILEKTSIINVKNKLHLEEVFSTKDTIYVKCPFCLSNKGEMKLNTTDNSYICKNCEQRGYAIGLYAKCKFLSNKKAYEELLAKDADLSNNLKTSIITTSRKNDEELDIVYQSFLDCLDLSSEHIMELLKYGFSIEDIEKIGFKTIPVAEKTKVSICRKLIEEGLDLEGIPGFYKDKKFRWNFKSHKGILVPITENHRIVALRIHLDSKYNTDTTDIWFSSSQECNGSKISNRIMFLFPEENKTIQLINDTNKKDIIMVSEMILAYKLHICFKNYIIVGVPNVISKKELKKLNIIKNVNNIHLVMDNHTILHNSENLLSSLYEIYPKEKIELHISLKDCEVPNSMRNLNKKYANLDIQKNIA